MDYCRVDYKNGFFEFFENDIPIYHQVDSGEQYIEYRSHHLMQKCYDYQRIKRLKKLPEGRKINVLYRKEKSESGNLVRLSSFRDAREEEEQEARAQRGQADLPQCYEGR